MKPTLILLTAALIAALSFDIGRATAPEPAQAANGATIADVVRQLRTIDADTRKTNALLTNSAGTNSAFRELHWICEFVAPTGFENECGAP